MPTPSGYPTSTVPQWATNPGTRTAPPAGLQATGWVAGTVLPAGTGNGLWGPLSDWVRYVALSSPSLGTWDVVDINVWSGATQYGDLTTATVGGSTMMILRAHAAAAGLAIGCLGGAKTTLLLDATTDTLTVFDVDTGDNHYQSTAAGGFIGPRASADGATGLRYSYPNADPVTIVKTFTPANGGWTFSQNPAGSFWYYDGNEWWRPFNLGGAPIATITTRHNLAEMISDNPEWVGTVLTLVGLDAEVDCLGVGQDVTVRVRRRTRASPTVITTIASVTRATAGNSVETWTGSVALAPQTYDYFLEIETLAVGAGTAGSGARIINVELNKYAVE